MYASGKQILLKDVTLVSFIDLACNSMPSDSYRRRSKSVDVSILIYATTTDSY